MKTDFQAKNIQEIFNVPKSRYEYITSGIGITPENEEVEGTGRSHLYSFKNLMQFAIAHNASKIGINPRTVKALLNVLSNSIELEEIGLFDPKKAIKVSIHYLEIDGKTHFKLSGQSVPEELQRSIHFTKDFQKAIEQLTMMAQAISSKEKVIDPAIEIKTKIAFENALTKNLLTTKGEDLENSNAYITINLGKIKERVLETIKMMK